MRIRVASIAAALLALGLAVQAEQFVLVDEAVTWTSSTGDAPTALGPSGWDWTSPANYYEGTIYMRIDVQSKPSLRLVAAQLCAWQDVFSKEGCCDAAMFRGTGVAYFKATRRPADFSKIVGGGLDWTREFYRVKFMLKDGSKSGPLLATSRCGQACYPGDDIDLHVPITHHATVIVVSKGGTLVPPADWHDCPAQWYGGTPVQQAGAEPLPRGLSCQARRGVLVLDGLSDGPAVVTIADAQGRVCARHELEGRGKQRVLSLPSARGVYAIRLNTENGKAATSTAIVH
jgi:hypothetical protein